MQKDSFKKIFNTRTLRFFCKDCNQAFRFLKIISHTKYCDTHFHLNTKFGAQNKFLNSDQHKASSNLESKHI
ncbi:hypothetical protein BpHYR1_007259 [Brachionus plicatilis]|uniref:Uncharacterized protein n=1 Tax=Brachionus plicatilis TaxID=10195 RepID=A0A3M7T7Z3_BRAPC|nr:hypothetical protein BpHYR1_007259 [Brachionus plicatilis]